ncbi:MAG: hypothetical protein R3E10_16935 [Gemmatimonadota bacterium]
MRFKGCSIGALTGLAVILASPDLHAQSGDPGSGPPPDTSGTELVFEREVFSYPSFARRNPFRPLASGDESGPRFEELVLLGVIYSTDPSASVALLSVGVQQAGSTTAKTFRVRRGDRLGNTRVLQIQRSRVLVEVEEFGLTEQRALEVKRPGQGGSR